MSAIPTPLAPQPGAQSIAQSIDYLEGLMEGFVAYDGDWRMTYMNAAAERILGRQRADVLGKTWHQAFPHAVGNAVDLMYQRVKSTRVAESMEYLYTHYDRWLEISASPVTGGGVGVYFRDVSDRKRAEEALKAANERLRDAARRKDEFLATLGHELRNPLAPIRNAVELMNLKGADDPVLQSARDMIDRQARHMVRLIDDLLDASRITTGKVELRRERVELAAVVEQALETSRPHLGGHEFTVTLPPQPVWLHADPVRLAQVLGNLLHNACKYTPPGGQIRLTAELAGEHALVTVRDSGIGIAAEHLPQLFEMFSQATPALERAQGGLGIGLALARALVEMHGGSIAAHSDGAACGSEFVVTLPVAGQAAATPPAKRRAAASSAARRVLVVDDNQDAAESLAMLLRAYGHSVQVTHDARAALEIAAGFAPDVVLLDLGMPGMNGYEACRALRAQPGGKTMHIVALTGWGQAEDQRRSRDAGFDHHLVKPVEAETLLNLLNRGRNG